MRAFLLAGIAAVTIAACAPEPGPAVVGGASVSTATATVESVDMASRTVRLRDLSGGGSFSVVAGPEVRNLAEIAPGDTVEVDVFEATLVDLADPADTGEAQLDIIAGRAPEGTTPGAGILSAVSFVVEVVSYDPATGVATFITPDGVTRTSQVRPGVRDFAAQRRPGDRVAVTLVEGVAVNIVEIEA
jgi:hypothetical protein